MLRISHGEREEYIDITRDRNKFKEILTLSVGKSLVPVIVKVSIGYST
jgi:hypothetical protein